MTTRRWVGVGVGIALLAIAVLAWKLRGDSDRTGPSALPAAPGTLSAGTGVAPFTNGTFRIEALPPRGYKLTATGPAGEAGAVDWFELAPGEARTGRHSYDWK